MEHGGRRFFRVGQVAALVGISVRALHHYDRIGLLRPASTSDGGYRLYAEADLLRLQQLLTLRYLGFPLARIGELLDRPDFDLVAAMRIQRRVLRDRIGELERIDTALDGLVRHRERSGAWDWELVAGASKEVGQMPEQREAEMESYYTPEQMKRFEEVGREVPRAEISAIEKGWATLIEEVRAARDQGLDPSSAEAAALAARWDALTQRTTSQFPPDLKEAVAANYERGSFEGEPRAPHAADFAWIERIKASGTETEQPS